MYDITAVYVIKSYHGDLKISDNESKRLDWFDIKNLPTNLTCHTKNYLDKFGDILQEAFEEYNEG